MVEAVHSRIKGRTRYKVQGLYRSRALKDFIEWKLSKSGEVLKASASSLTGNVLLHYNSGNTPQSISRLLETVVADYHRMNGGAPSKRAPSRARLGRERTERQLISFPAFHKTRPGKALRSISAPEDQKERSWHLMGVDAVLDHFNVSGDTGLAVGAAAEQLKRFGPNVLPESQTRSRLDIFLGQFTTLPVALLSAAAGLSVVTGGVLDAAVIMGVVVMNATIGFTTENNAERTISSLKNLVKPSALVIREDKQMEIPADQVVPGDLMVLKPGVTITADGRVVEAVHLSVDESALTGESMPVSKSVPPLDGDHIPLADRSTMVYTGTLVTGGQGLAVVTATGSYTQIGQLQALVGETRPPQTPLEKQLKRVGNHLVVISGGVCGLVFVVGLVRGYTLMEMLRTSINLAAAAVPEGLPTVAITTLAFGIRKMKQHHVLVRQLGAVETLGCVQTVCFDKTGTITRNRMSVVSVYTGATRIKVQGGRFYQQQDALDPLKREEMLRLMQVGVLCSETQLFGEGDGKARRYALKGSPTENALVRMALDAGVEVKSLRKAHPLLEVTHRSENRLFMSTLHEAPEGGRLIALKGSPMEVLDMCDGRLKDGERLPIEDEDRENIEIENERMAGKALRVLGMACARLEEGAEPDAETEFTWLGLVGMADPIREGVKELVGVFHQAGIETVMITGDQSPTAYSVGKRLNLSKGKQIEILDSSHLNDLSEEALEALAKRAHVFSRVSPAHKLQIVQALQKAGRVTAMTGDGINDGPALKAADIGIAMGTTGTDIAREVADVVLEEDNLETLVVAVADGRAIYENIRKPVHFFLATNLSEIMVTFVCIAGALGHPLNAMQLLWINTLSDIFPGLALAMEAPEPDVMDRPPRDPQEPIVKRSDFKRVAFEAGALSAGALGAYGYGILRYGVGARASTLAFQGLTMGQLLHALSCRSEAHSIFDRKERLEPNPYLNLALGGSFALQALTIIVPGLRSFLGLTPMGLLDAFVVGAGALLPLVANEATKNTAQPRLPRKGEIRSS